MSGDSSEESTWIDRDLPIQRMLARPIRRFLHLETAGGLVLLVAAIAALIIANTAWSGVMERFWERDLTLLAIGDFHLEESLRGWINDGLMTIFFFVVGLEIKLELVSGELRDRKRASLPVLAAFGGMVVPAALYAAINAGGAGSDGWGIPMATDIAFVVGALALLGSRVPSGLKAFVLTVAIVDDIGAIVVIGIFYTERISFGWLAVAGAGLALVVLMRLRRVWYVPAYVLVGVIVWLATLESGIHATIAGVALGLLAPATSFRPETTRVDIDSSSPRKEVRSTLFDVRESNPIAQRLQDIVHPWSAFIILPLFAFANAGIRLSSDAISEAIASPVAWGIVVGLVVGKPVGILAATWLGIRLHLGAPPPGVTSRHLVAASVLAGIGFTVALFITGLAFTAEDITAQAQMGVTAASLVAAVIGVLIMRGAKPGQAGEPQ
ncbi:MAG: Na+/H+ antiporter NhaA [Acidimicrobiia bacterium]|nr:Na+/H+ antiporter NhaA [Acidimicrobiia bacterium]